MKDERNVRHRRTAGGNWRPVAIILAAVLMVLSVPLGGRAVFAADSIEPVKVDTPCSLKVNIGAALPDEEKADLAEAGIVVDLYRVADAVDVAGYDTYTWSVNEPYKAALDKAGVQITDKIDNDTWRKVADVAALTALGEVPEGTDTMEPKPAEGVTRAAENKPVNEQITDLKAGLYLIIPHGNEATTGKEYVSTRTDSTGAKNQVTLAVSNRYTYTFTPELVSLPNRVDEYGVNNTANTTIPWQYEADVDLTLKYGKEERFGQLEIVKNLENFEDHNSATFIFEVIATRSQTDDTEVYHDYFSIEFTEFGEGHKSVIVDKLPVGAYVTVKESYSGKVYNVDENKTAGPITAEEIAKVEFNNKYDNRHNGGGSVTNHFVYDGNQNKWGWEQVTDSSTDGKVIQSSEKSE